MTQKTIILNSAVAQQSLFVISFTEANKGIWADTNHLRMDVGGRGRRKTFRDAYVWDLYRMAELIGEEVYDGNGYWQIKKDDPNWHPAWVEGFTITTGSSVYENLPTPFGVSPFTRPLATGYVQKANLKFSPLIPAPIIKTDEDGNIIVERQAAETEPGELVFYKAIVYPGYPIMISASTPSNEYYFGPSFVESVRISCSGTGQLSPVNISIDIVGGRSIISEKMISVSPEVIDIEPQLVTIQSDDSDPEESPIASDEEATEDYRHYRVASTMDALVDFKLYNSADEMIEAMDTVISTEALNAEQRLVTADISLNQNWEFAFTALNLSRTDQNGPRFASLTKRSVKGSLVFWSRSNDFEIPNTSALTLYFGSIWFFPMPNVEFQPVKVEGNLKSGFFYTFEFLARAAPLSIQKGFTTSALDYPISEFWLSSNDLQATPGKKEEKEEEIGDDEEA
jgi:hypothetical protein